MGFRPIPTTFRQRFAERSNFECLFFAKFPKTSLRHFRRKVIGQILLRKTPVCDRGGPGLFGHGEAEAICNALDYAG